MQTVLIVIHLMIVLALVGLVLIQRSEGGGLGIGGGSGFMSARGTANALTRTTAILATLFFITSLGMSILARYQGDPTDILDRIPQSTSTDGTGSGAGVLDKLGGSVNSQTPAANGTTQAPTTTAPSTTAPAAGAETPAQGSTAPTQTPPADNSGVPTGQ
ncbi:preprotein translocase subunit SecG [Rhizobium sp. PAMB 3182]